MMVIVIVVLVVMLQVFEHGYVSGAETSDTWCMQYNPPGSTSTRGREDNVKEEEEEEEEEVRGEGE